MCSFNNKRILVTGGSGFIGSHLIAKLLQDPENTVICVDNCSSGNKSNLNEFFNNPRFEFIRKDIVEPVLFEIDRIYHLACPASPDYYQKNGIKTLKTCFLGTLNILGLAKRTGSRLLLASTSEIYGDPLVHPQTESYQGNVNPNGIRSCYDEGKRISESLCYEYQRLHNTDIRVARIFNTYGPKMLENDGRVISNFISQKLNNKPITVFGEGNQTRSFCYIDDLVKGLISLMESEYSKTPVNLGNPKEHTILELANTINRIVNQIHSKDNKENSSVEKTNIKFCCLPSDDPQRRNPDISLAMKELKQQPNIDLEDGLKMTIKYFMDLKKQNNFM